jgi:hypothetical protein
MKRTLTVIVGFSLLVLVLAASAGAGDVPRLRANVPFSFYAGNHLVPAGEYVFQMQAFANRAAGSIVLVRNHEGRVIHMFAAIPASSPGNVETCLIFNRYGDSHFLAKLQNSAIQAALIKSHAERELALAYAKQAAGSVIVAASR